MLRSPRRLWAADRPMDHEPGSMLPSIVDLYHSKAILWWLAMQSALRSPRRTQERHPRTHFQGPS